MLQKYGIVTLALPLLALCLLLAACGGTASPSSKANTAPGNTAAATSTRATFTPQNKNTTGTVVKTQATPVSSSSNNGLVIVPPAPEGNNQGVQEAKLSDRVLVLEKVSHQQDSDNTTNSVSVTVTVKNTSAQVINNQSSYYQLVSPQGDTFGLQANVSADFYGSIASGSSRTGTITFTIPIGLTKGLSLLYRPDQPVQTVTIALNS